MVLRYCLIFLKNRPWVAASGLDLDLIDCEPITAVLADQFISFLYIISTPGAVTNLTGIEGCTNIAL